MYIYIYRILECIYINTLCCFLLIQLRFFFVWICGKCIAKIPLNSKMAGRFFCSHFPRMITPLAVASLGPSRRYEGIITASCSMGSVTVFNQCNEAPCNDTQRCGTGGPNQVNVRDFRYQLMSGELVVWHEPRACAREATWNITSLKNIFSLSIPSTLPQTNHLAPENEWLVGR